MWPALELTNLVVRATTESPTVSVGLGQLAAPSCPRCRGRLDLGSPHTLVRAARIRVFCSSECLDAWQAPPEQRAPEREIDLPVSIKPGLLGRILVAGLALGGLSSERTSPVAPLEQPRFDDGSFRAQKVVPPVVAVDAGADGGLDDDALAARLFAEASRDPWVHPLPAPRRMPLRDSRVFGAERPGDRPAECRSGHCGVDLGQRWGEPVLAAHAGVVDQVRRVDRGRGGMFVRLAHRDGTVLTQYFHLAAIPNWVVRGAEVRLGDIIGMVGDTGVKSSGPHLHFTIAVRPSPGAPLTHIDPEPLIALWPVVDRDSLTIAESSARPGVPRGAAGRKYPRRHRRAPVEPDAAIAPEAAIAD